MTYVSAATTALVTCGLHGRTVPAQPVSLTKDPIGRYGQIQKENTTRIGKLWPYASLTAGSFGTIEPTRIAYEYMNKTFTPTSSGLFSSGSEYEKFAFETLNGTAAVVAGVAGFIATSLALEYGAKAVIKAYDEGYKYLHSKKN